MQWRRLLTVSGFGAGAGGAAALVAYAIREPEPLFGRTFSMPTVDDVTLSDETWAIVGLTLLGALVCGTIAMSYVVRKGCGRMLLAGLIAAPIGAVLCWGSRWLMDLVIYALVGGPETQLDLAKALRASVLPWFVWQVAVGFGLTIPIVLAIGPNKFTVFRGLIGAALIPVLGYLIGNIAGVVMAVLFIPAAVGGGSATDLARVGDTIYLFTLGAATGLAFAIAEVLYKPAWLRSFAGPTEGKTWALTGQIARVGSAEGLEVKLPHDGFIAPLQAHVMASEDGHYLVDMAGSATVNGAPPQHAWLQDGDRIGVGSHVLIYRTRLAPTGKPALKPVEAVGHVGPVGQPSGSASHSRPASPTSPTAPTAPPTPTYTLIDPLGRKHELKPGSNILGRDSSCDIVLSFASSVSRRHAEIIVSSDSVAVNDLGSTNGTFMNGSPVKSLAPIAPGDRVSLGSCELVLSSL